MSEEISFEFIF